MQKWIMMQNWILLPLLLCRHAQRSVFTIGLAAFILTGYESTAGRIVCGWACGGSAVTLIDEARYKPDNKGRWPA